MRGKPFGELRLQALVLAVGMTLAFGARPGQGLAHEQQRSCKSCDNHQQGEPQQGRARAVERGQIAGDDARQPHRGIARELVDAGGKSPLLGAGDVHLAGHRHAPGETLVDAEKQIGRDHPPPVGRKVDQQRDGYGCHPAHHQHRLAPDALGQPPSDEIEHALDQPEGDDEAHQVEKGRFGHAKVLLRHHRQHIAFHADDQADETHLHRLPDELVQVDADALQIGFGRGGRVEVGSTRAACRRREHCAAHRRQGAVSCSSGSPAACHSGTPSAILRARKPRSTSSFTAVSDITQNGPRQ